MFEFLLQSECLITPFILGLLTSLVLYWYLFRKYDYWKKRNINFERPLPFFGTALNTMIKTTVEVENKRYSKYGPVYGYFERGQPILSVADPKLLKDILVKDFACFTSSMEITGNKLLDNMLPFLSDKDWKRVRSIISPAFTTLKLKKLLRVLKESSKTLESNIRSALEETKHIDMKRLYGAFVIDVITHSAFSTQIDSHNDPNNAFVKSAKNVFTNLSKLRTILFFIPWLNRFRRIFKAKQQFDEGLHFFKTAILEIIKERRMTGQVWEDLLQILIDNAKEVLEDETTDIASNHGKDFATTQLSRNLKSKKLSVDELVAQSAVFFLAGYEAPVTTLSFATYLLALNPDVQDKLHEEVMQLLNDNENELPYDAIQNMKYLDNVISETLRMYPPTLRLQRIADADYKLRDTGLVIPKGMTVTIPVFPLHWDHKLFPNPEKFDPDRFSPEEKAKIDPYTYLPFGIGPRACLGMRFGLLEMKVCLIHMISSFNFKRSPYTKVPFTSNGQSNLFLEATDITVELEIR